MARGAGLLLLLPGLRCSAGFLGVATRRLIHPDPRNERYASIPHQPLPVSLIAPSSLVSENSPSSTLSNGIDTRPENEVFKDLYSLVNSAKGKLLRLDKASNSDVRGVFVNRAVKKGEVLLSIPLSFCLRDDKPPTWIPDYLKLMSNEYDDDTDEGSTECVDALWASRLAASVLDSQLKILRGEVEDKELLLWFSLLPEPSFLRASLPVHWSETVVSKAKCIALELAVDSSFFSRAQAVQDLVDSLDGCREAESLVDESKRDLVNNALDLVQTRTCRVLAADGAPIRLFAPVFDLINHDSNSVNAEFGLENECLVVRALKTIRKNEEVLIDYGASARPDWKCLNSYGFVPGFRPGIPVNDGDHTAEVFLEGQRFEVGPDSVSEELVFAMAQALGEAGDPEKVNLTPNIALRLAQRIAEAAFQTLLIDEEADDLMDPQEEEIDDDDESCPRAVDVESPEEVISERLAASLRWNQHRILMACSLGLRDWAMQQT